MQWTLGKFLILAGLMTTASVATAAFDDSSENYPARAGYTNRAQVGPRPFYLVDNMDDSVLKTALQRCADRPTRKSNFSIGHRGAAMQFPEHTKQSYEAAARMGAGIVECDVTFTKDRQLVCRHSQCDLHTTTNILAIPELAAKCTTPFSAAQFDTTGKLTKAASANCCTSDITLAEFKTLCGKMDASNPNAKTVAEYLGGTATWRTDLYSACGTVMSHAESIDLFTGLGVKMTPELKSPSVKMPFQGDYTQEAYAQQMINEYKTARVSPWDVWAQSFDLNDVLYWINKEPAFGRQAVYLDDANELKELPTLAELQSYAAKGVNIVAPPMWALLALDSKGQIVPSDYARNANAAGLDIITWTLERSGLLTDGGGWYYQTVNSAIKKPGDTMVALDVLARDVGVIGVFSDWPATVTYYANCMGLR